MNKIGLVIKREYLTPREKQNVYSHDHIDAFADRIVYCGNRICFRKRKGSSENSRSG